MKKISLPLAIVFSLFSGFCFAYEPSGQFFEADEPQSYVQICTKFGANYYYLPGSTDTCMNPLTGQIRTTLQDGSIHISESDLALEVRWLEDRIALLEAMLLPAQ